MAERTINYTQQEVRSSSKNEVRQMQPKKDGLALGVAGESRNQNQAVISTTNQQNTSTTPKGTNAGLVAAKQ